MYMESINLKLEKNLLKNIDISLKRFNFSTRTEFIRDAIRDKLTELEKQEAIKKLAELKGSLKGKSKMSYEQAREIAARNIFKRYGVDLD